MKALGIAVTCLMAIVGSSSGAEVTLKTTDKEPPQDTTASVKNLLEAKAVQLMAGDKALYEFWWRKDVPLTEKPASVDKGLAAVAELTFLGLVTVGDGHRDYKDNEIPAGTYTVRFGLQPQDGDHLGTSEFPYFAVLIPSKADPDPAGIKTYKAMVKASGKATPAGHPAVLSLRPVTSQAEPNPALTTPAPEHKAIRFKLPAKAGDQSANLVFELVYEGKFKG